MGYTMAEKLLMRNVGRDHLEPGELVITHPDRYMIHDIYTPFVVQKLDEMKFRRLRHPERGVIFLDHLCPTNQAIGDPRHYHKGFELSDRFGIQAIHPGEGISHTLMHEYGYAKPGTLVVATDSHTPTYGGGGCFCTGIGYTEMAAVLGSGEMWMRVPEAIQITVEGKLPPNVYAKDIVLRVLADLRSDGGTYKSLEYVGSTIRGLDMSGRYTIANMSLEAGCKTALFPADQKTADYFGMPLSQIDWIFPDPDAHYVRHLHYRAEELTPYLSCPQGVDNVHPIAQVEGTPLNEVYIGSCTNGSLDDMAVAASILKGRTVAKYMKLVIIPASISIYKECIRLGYMETFLRAGAMVCHPCCGLCCGQPYGLMSDGEVVLGTNNRNFIGRMGTIKSLIYLASPAVAAASALTGVITDPLKLPANP